MDRSCCCVILMAKDACLNFNRHSTSLRACAFGFGMSGRPSDFCSQRGNEDSHPCPTPSQLQCMVKAERKMHYFDGERDEFESPQALKGRMSFVHVCSGLVCQVGLRTYSCMTRMRIATLIQAHSKFDIWRTLNLECTSLTAKDASLNLNRP